MTSRRVALADQQVVDMQKAFSAVQAGLERVDSVVGAAEAVGGRSQRTTRIALVLAGLAILVAALWSFKRNREQE
ncbi:MAG: hypothetical protein ACR2QE_20085 [Acidimicrobiales bacterium]